MRTIHFFLLLFLLGLFSNAQKPYNKFYDIIVSTPDSMNYIMVEAKLDISGLDIPGSDTLYFDLCRDFKGIFFDSLRIFVGNENIDFLVRNEYEICCKVPYASKSEKEASFTFRYILSKKSDYDEIPFSDFAFQANKNDAHINAAITRTDDWIPKLQEESLKRLPPFQLAIISPIHYEIMASGILVSTEINQDRKKWIYRNYDGITDRSLYFFINNNNRVVTTFNDGFRIIMLLPPDTLKGNVDFLADLVYKSYRCFEMLYGKTNLNEYKLNSFVNDLGYSGLFNSCNAPDWLFTQPIHNNELFYPCRDLIHEVSHTWWGNMVAPDASTDYWLFEGFAKFSEPTFLKTIKGDKIELLYRKRLRIVIASDIDFMPPLRFNSPEIENNTLKSEGAYYQGALFLYSLKELMGEDNFWKGMRTYIQDNKGKTVDSDDFFAAMQNHTDLNIHNYFYDYLNKTGFAEYSTKLLSNERKDSIYVSRIEIMNTGKKELFTNFCPNSDLDHDTSYLYIPVGQREIIEIARTSPDTANLVLIDPDEVYLVRRKGLQSPGAKFYTDTNGKLRLINVIPGSPFDHAGLKDYMIISSVNGSDISKKDIYEQHRLIQQSKGQILNIEAISDENKSGEFIVQY